MINLSARNTNNAVLRCKQLKPSVRYVADRIFDVYSSNNANVYRVSFTVLDGQKYGQCSCEASKHDQVCYHLVAAAAANIYRQGLKKSAAIN